MKIFLSPSAYGTYFELLQLNAYVPQVHRVGLEGGSISGLHALEVSGSSSQCFGIVDMPLVPKYLSWKNISLNHLFIFLSVCFAMFLMLAAAV